MDQPIAQPESPYEASRRIANLLRLGTVAEVRLQPPARCRVKTGDLLTDWLPWLTLRAGGVDGGATWWAPVAGEQCLLLAPGGDLLQAVVLPGIYSDSLPQPSDKPEQLHIVLDKSRIVVKKDSITLSADGGRLIIDRDGVHGAPDVTAAGVSLVGHPHSGVMPGGGTSGPPESTVAEPEEDDT